MQRPTSNRITQGAHLTSQAVDYSWYPDPAIYAPEDGRIESYGVAGDCGNNLRMRTDDHIHSFCHLERPLVSPGQSVSRGQPIGIMGYTGRTIPTGPNGRHLHHFIRYDNGRYVYPPNIANESFITQGGEEVITKDDVGILRIGHSEIGGWEINETHSGKHDQLFLNAWQGKPVKDFIWAQWRNGEPYRTAKQAQDKAVKDLNALVNASKAELEAARAKVTEANQRVELAEKKATEAGIKYDELEAEKIKDTETGNAFLRFLARLFRQQ